MKDRVVFTKHARERMQLRRIHEDDVRKTLSHPERTVPEEKPDTARCIRTVHGRELHVILKHLSEQQKTLVISVWVRGEDDPVPLAWLLITLPLRAAWWLIQQCWKLLHTKRNH